MQSSDYFGIPRQTITMIKAPFSAPFPAMTRQGDRVALALSYDGSVTMGSVNGLGSISFVEGSPTPAVDSSNSTGSLVRIPDGNDSDDAASDWAFTSNPTPGAANLP